MADAELHIVVKNAGNVEKLAALLNAAMELKLPPVEVRTIVPEGYRCEECWQNDGDHAGTCSIGIQVARDRRVLQQEHEG